MRNTAYPTRSIAEESDWRRSEPVLLGDVLPELMLRYGIDTAAAQRTARLCPAICEAELFVGEEVAIS